MEPGVDAHRHADRQREGCRHKAELERGWHFLQDDLTDRPRLLVGEAEIAACGTTDKPGELYDEAVVEPQLLPQPLAIGDTGILPNHATYRVADIIEQRKSDHRHRQHNQNGLEEALNEKGEHRLLLISLVQLNVAQLEIIVAHRGQIDIVSARPYHDLLMQRDVSKILFNDVQSVADQLVALFAVELDLDFLD